MVRLYLWLDIFGIRQFRTVWIIQLYWMLDLAGEYCYPHALQDSALMRLCYLLRIGGLFFNLLSELTTRLIKLECTFVQSGGIMTNAVCGGGSSIEQREALVEQAVSSKTSLTRVSFLLFRPPGAMMCCRDLFRAPASQWHCSETIGGARCTYWQLLVVFALVRLAVLTSS